MTVPHYGKREPGLLTAASPGDTLYFPFASYNDSGDSEVLTGLAVTDIEVIKNGLPTVRATDSGYSLISDTGMIGDRAALYRCSIQLFNTADDASFYASGSWYNAFIDAVTIDGRTVRFHLGSWEIGRQRVDVRELIGDTGAANWLQQTFAAGFADTGINQRFAQIQSDVDTGLRVHIDDSDTGIKDTIADLDTGLRDHIDNTDTGLRKYIDNLDTGIKDRFNDLAEDTGGVNINAIQGDTGAAGWLRAVFANGFTDTGIYSRIDKLAEDTGGVNINSIQGDTGAAAWLRATFASGFTDTGLNERLARIQSDVDTGLRVHIDDLDTGLRKFIDNLDTGIKNRFDDLAEDTGGVNINAIAGDTGAAGWLKAAFANGFADTGLYSRIDKLSEDTGGVNINSIQGDTGAAAWLRATFASGFTDTGLNERLARIQSDVDTGLRVHIDDLDTGLHDTIADLDTGLRDFIDNTDTGTQATLTAIQAKTDKLTFDTGNELHADIRKVNGVSVQGTGANGDEWRP